MRTEILRFRKEEGSPPLIGYLPALYPNPEDFERIATICFQLGLKFMEVGIPIENPYLDGHIISKALKDLSQRKTELKEYLSGSGLIVHSAGMHGLSMLYNETLDLNSIDLIIEECSKTDLEAILVPNITVENRENLYRASLGTGIEVVNFIGINHSEQEIEEIIRLTTGFLYLQSTGGSTGGQITGNNKLKERLLTIRKRAESYELPVALGFGINTPDDAKLAADLGADAVIVGTSFLKAAQAGTDLFSDFLKGFHPFLEGTKCIQ